MGQAIGIIIIVSAFFILLFFLVYWLATSGRLQDFLIDTTKKSLGF